MLSIKHGQIRLARDAGHRTILRPETGLAAMLGLAALALALGLAHSPIPGALHWTPVLAAQARWMALAAMLGAGCAARPRAHALSGWRAPALLAGGWALLCFGPGAVAALAMVALSALGLGRAALALAGAEAAAPDEDVWAAPLAGLAGLILVLNALGATTMNMRPAFWLLPALGALMLWRDRARLSWHLPEAAPLPVGSIPILAPILFAALFATASAALPERLWDALAMHLLIPSQIATFGHWSGDPRHLAFSFFPIGADHLFAMAYALGGERAAQLLNLTAWGTTLGLLYAMARARGGARPGGLAVLAAMAIPAALASTGSVFVENTLGLLILGALRLLGRRGGRAQCALILVLAALPGVKLHGAVVAVAVGALALGRQPWRQAGFTRAMALGGGAIALGLVPFVHAWAVAGNPVFPMFNPIFRSPYWPATEFADPRWQGGLSLMLPWRLVFHTGAYMECWDGALGFTLALLLPAGVAAAALARDAAPRRVLAVVGIYLLVVFGQVQYLRYAVPVFAPLALLGVEAMVVLAALPGARRAAEALVVLAALAGMAAYPTGSWSLASGDVRALFDPAQRHALLVQDAPVRLANTLIDRLAAGQPRVLYAADPFGAFLRGTPVYVNWYNPVLAAQIAAAHGDAALARVVAGQHAAYVIAEPDAVDRAARRIAALMARRETPIARIGGVFVYRGLSP